jgi:hypothetical protein
MSSGVIAPEVSRDIPASTLNLSKCNLCLAECMLSSDGAIHRTVDDIRVLAALERPNED